MKKTYIIPSQRPTALNSEEQLLGGSLPIKGDTDVPEGWTKQSACDWNIFTDEDVTE